MDLDRGQSHGKQAILLIAQIISVILAIGTAFLALLAIQLEPGQRVDTGGLLWAATKVLIYWGLAIVFAHTRSKMAAETKQATVREAQFTIPCPNGHAIRCRFGDAGSRIRCAACGAWAEVPSYSELPSNEASSSGQ